MCSPNDQSCITCVSPPLYSGERLTHIDEESGLLSQILTATNGHLNNGAQHQPDSCILQCAPCTYTLLIKLDNLDQASPKVTVQLEG